MAKWKKRLHWYVEVWQRNEAWITKHLALLKKIQAKSDEFGMSTTMLTHGERSVLLTHIQFYRHSVVRFHKRKERDWDELVQLEYAGEWILKQIALGKLPSDTFDKEGQS